MMIELVMYGMIPSENTAIRVSAPPENRLMNCRKFWPPWFVACGRCVTSIDRDRDVGRRTGRRTMMNSVKKIFFRRSGILKALTKALSTADCYPPPGTPVYAMSSTDPPRLLDLLLRGSRDTRGPDRQRPVDLAPAEHLHGHRPWHEAAFA